MVSNHYQPCKVCKLGDDFNIPDVELNPSNNSLSSAECKPFDQVDEAKRKKFGLHDKNKFSNCLATIFESGTILCYKCEENYYFDGKSETCKNRDSAHHLKGCVMSYDNKHCVFCQDGFQMDYRYAVCKPESHEIDYKTYFKNMQQKMQEQMQESMQEVMSGSNNSYQNQNAFQMNSNQFNSQSQFSDPSQMQSNYQGYI